MKLSLVHCTETILAEISDERMHQRDIAQTYRFCMESTEAVDWYKINEAIRERWSVAGLIRVKTMAHSGSCFAERKS